MVQYNHTQFYLFLEQMLHHILPLTYVCTKRSVLIEGEHDVLGKHIITYIAKPTQPESGLQRSAHF